MLQCGMEEKVNQYSSISLIDRYCLCFFFATKINTFKTRKHEKCKYCVSLCKITDGQMGGGGWSWALETSPSGAKLCCPTCPKCLLLIYKLKETFSVAVQLHTVVTGSGMSS